MPAERQLSGAEEALPSAPARGNWTERIPLVLLLVFLWSLLILGIGYLTVQSLQGQIDLGSARTLENLLLVFLIGVVAVGTTLYVRVKWR